MLLLSTTCPWVADLRMVATVGVLFDSHHSITNYQIITDSLSIAKTLPPSGRAVYDFSQPKVQEHVHAPGDLEHRACCFVVKYRRSVDMKPKLKLIMLVIAESPDGKGELQFYLPADFSAQMTMFSPSGNLSPFFKMKTAVRTLLKGMDFPLGDID